GHLAQVHVAVGQDRQVGGRDGAGATGRLGQRRGGVDADGGRAGVGLLGQRDAPRRRHQVDVVGERGGGVVGRRHAGDGGRNAGVAEGRGLRSDGDGGLVSDAEAPPRRRLFPYPPPYRFGHLAQVHVAVGQDRQVGGRDGAGATGRLGQRRGGVDADGG